MKDRTVLKNEPIELQILDIQSVEIEGLVYLLEDPFVMNGHKMLTTNYLNKTDHLDGKLNEFSLWTFHISHEYLIVTDFQGIKRFNENTFKMEYVLTEPMIFSKDKRYGSADLGNEALQSRFLELQLTVKCQIQSTNESSNSACFSESMSVLNEMQQVKRLLTVPSEPLDILDQHAIEKLLKITPDFRLNGKSLLGDFGPIYGFQSASNDRLMIKFDKRSNDLFIFLKSCNGQIPMIYLEYVNDWLASLRRDVAINHVPDSPLLTLSEFLNRVRCLDVAKRTVSIWAIYFFLLRILFFLDENDSFSYFFAPENFILTEKNSNTLGFDLKLMCNEHAVRTEGEYNAPELFATIKSNIWSLGMIIYKAIHNKLPYEAYNLKKSSVQPRHGIRVPRLENEPSLSLLGELIEPCLRWDSSTRISVPDLYLQTKRSICNTHFQNLFEIIF
jgi:hypothetical protein